jgi:HK97 family phage major capsid protein
MPETMSGSRRLEWLRRQRDTAFADVESITERAADQDRDLTDSEEETCQARRSRIASLDDDIKVEVELAERSATYAGLVANVGPPTHETPTQAVQRSNTPEPPVYEDPGSYLVDFLLRSESPEARQRMERYHQRAVAHQTTAQNPGLLPTPILGPVFIQATQRRPAVEATTRRPLPGAGKTFQRPKISQHTLAGPQSAEKAELPSRPLTVDPVTVTKATYGGAINLSWQDRDWTDPAIMNLLVSDLAAAYAQATDAAFCTYFAGAVTGTGTIDDSSSGEAWLSGIYGGAGDIYSVTNALPDALWVSPDVWGTLGSMVDGSGRPMFPTVGPMNALGNIQPTNMGGSVAGMRLVVDRNLAAGTAILGDSTYVETYETVGGQVSVTEPSVLGTQMAFYGYMAWLVLEPTAFVKFTITAPVAAGTQSGGGGQTSSHSSSGKKAS